MQRNNQISHFLGMRATTSSMDDDRAEGERNKGLRKGFLQTVGIISRLGGGVSGIREKCDNGDRLRFHYIGGLRGKELAHSSRI